MCHCEMTQGEFFGIYRLELMCIPRGEHFYNITSEKGRTQPTTASPCPLHHPLFLEQRQGWCEGCLGAHTRRRRASWTPTSSDFCCAFWKKGTSPPQNKRSAFGLGGFEGNKVATEDSNTSPPRNRRLGALLDSSTRTVSPETT